MMGDVSSKKATDRSSKCRREGCEAERRRFSTGTLASFCVEHENERLNAIKTRLVLDPVTGEMVRASTLATRTWRRAHPEAERRTKIAELEARIAALEAEKAAKTGAEQ